MKNSYIPKLTLPTQSPVSMGNTLFSPGGPSGLQAKGMGNQVSFKNVMLDTVGKVNETLAKPDAMMMETITNGTYDVHDVMLAGAKAELAVTITAQLTTKVVQAYDRILQIQV